ncbi:hypothetical protein [Candidatus Ichthyocystis sparus]|nr:hypothetical protein [Candidatus Ichthyocystis sparus]
MPSIPLFAGTCRSGSSFLQRGSLQGRGCKGKYKLVEMRVGPVVI